MRSTRLASPSSHDYAGSVAFSNPDYFSIDLKVHSSKIISTYQILWHPSRQVSGLQKSKPTLTLLTDAQGRLTATNRTAEPLSFKVSCPDNISPIQLHLDT